jgi:hypothetical protein
MIAVFELIDISASKTIEEIELLVAVKIAGVSKLKHINMWKAFRRYVI